MFKITLRMARELSGYTVGEVSRHCHVSIVEMGRLENDPGEMPKVVACKIRRLYGISLDSLCIGNTSHLAMN